MSRPQPQMSLFDDFVPDPPQTVTEPAKPQLTLVKSEPVSDDTFNGYPNSATYSAALTLENDCKSCVEFKRLFLAGQLTEKAVEAQFRKAGFEVDSWAEGSVDWDLIRDDYDTQFRDEIAMETYPSSVTDALKQMTIEGNVAKATRQLDRKLWVQLDQILNILGGKWNKKAKGHVFDDDPSDLIGNVILTGKVTKPENYGFFPTPQALASEVVKLAEIEPWMTVLEPSAGIGNLCDEIARFSTKISCFELQDKNVKVLAGKGYQVTTGDFMEMEPCGSFDLVIMNPPFEKQQDVKHVMHACGFLRPGGRLVAIMSPSFTFRSDKRSADFREFVEKYGYYRENPAGSFKESGTGVNTVTVVLDMPAWES